MKKSFGTRCNEPLAEVCLKEAHERGMNLTELSHKAGVSWATLMNFKRIKHPHGVSLRTMKGLAKGINARVVILTNDGRILDPEAMTEI